MKLTEPFLLDPSNVTPNKQKKLFFKLMANALFGKLEQRNDKSRTVFVDNQKDLEQIFFSENNIEDIFCINKNICQVQIASNVLKLPPNRNGNCYIGAQLTAYARQTIYEHLITLEKCNATIYQIDCDSIIFSLLKDQTLPLKVNDAVGSFKHEVVGDLKSYYSLGPKNYSLTFESNGVTQTLSKVRGLSLNNSLNDNIFNDECFKYYIEQFLKKRDEKVYVKQYRKRGDFKRLKITSKLEEISFSNALSTRRIVDMQTPNCCTYPYGYKKEN